MTDQTFAIVGGGLAGATAAEHLRGGGFDGRLYLFAAEPHLPYLRPPLSKEYLTGTGGRDGILVHPEAWYREQGVALELSHEVTSLGDHRLTLANGREVVADRVLLATGASPRTLDVPGAGRASYLRTVEDSEALKRSTSAGGRSVVVIGGGWIGLEFAAAARTYGNDVTVVMREAVALSPVLGDELGLVFQQLHESHGVQFVVGEVRSIGADAVVTSAGTFPAELVVVGIGAIANTGLAAAAGLEVDNGILVDEHLATSAPDVFAAGDVANAFHPVLGARLRSEHWANAIAGGKVAASSMLGGSAVLDDIPYFYTDQYDLGMEYSGFGPLTVGAEVVYRGDRAAREFIAFWLASGRVVAGMNVNVWDVNEGVQALIRSGRAVDPARLADPAIPLGEV